MKRKNEYSEERIGKVLRRVDQGASSEEVCEELGISSTTLHRWLHRYGHTPAERVERVRHLEAEVRRLEETVSDLTLGERLQRSVMRRLMPDAPKRRAELQRLQDAYGVSERKACHLLGWPRSSHRYVESTSDDDGLRDRLLELATEHPDAGYRKLWKLLKAEGFHVNHKRIYRLYSEEGLHEVRKTTTRTADGNGGPERHEPRATPPGKAKAANHGADAADEAANEDSPETRRATA